MDILRCKEPFAFDTKAGPRVVTVGQLVDSNDPLVRGREHLFEPLEISVQPVVEQATASPGEKRSVKPAK